MKINLAKSAGFCFGVKRALNIAFEIAKQKPRVFMLGDIVHNEDVVRQIQRCGIKKISKLGSGKGKILLIRAHGASKNTIEQASKLGYQIIDATCPMVKEIHKIATGMENQGFKIVVIGDKNHDEVRGIVGQLKNKALIMDDAKNMNRSFLKNLKKVAVVVQSTQNIEKVDKILRVLRENIPLVKFFNTICRPTQLKQGEIRKMPLENDVMIVIGSKNSANTRRLFEISKSLNERSYWVAKKEDVKPNWFKNVRSVGITAGASTPDETTHEIIEYLKNLKR